MNQESFFCNFVHWQAKPGSWLNQLEVNTHLLTRTLGQHLTCELVRPPSSIDLLQLLQWSSVLIQKKRYSISAILLHFSPITLLSIH